MTSVLTEFIGLLVGGISGIAQGIGGGVSTLAESIFLTGDTTKTLSVFGGILGIFAGISLAVGLSRWVMNLITSLGAKK